MLLKEFIGTVYLLAAGGQWQLIIEYFRLIGEIVDQPVAVITPGKPKDKEN